MIWVWENEWTLHADNMAHCVVDEGTITSNRVLQSFDGIRSSPVLSSTAWIHTEIPVPLSQCPRNLPQSSHYSKQTKQKQKMTLSSAYLVLRQLTEWSMYVPSSAGRVAPEGRPARQENAAAKACRTARAKNMFMARDSACQRRDSSWSRNKMVIQNLM